MDPQIMGQGVNRGVRLILEKLERPLATSAEIDLQEQRAYIPAKWPSSPRVADLEWTLRPPDQDGLVHGPGQGAQSLLEHVWENC